MGKAAMFLAMPPICGYDGAANDILKARLYNVKS
jgi:hypothetical protein